MVEPQIEEFRKDGYTSDQTIIFNLQALPGPISNSLSITSQRFRWARRSGSPATLYVQFDAAWDQSRPSPDLETSPEAQNPDFRVRNAS